MSQHISDFYTQVQAKDFARQFQFRVTEMANTNFGEDTFVYLQAGNLPGRAINNVQVPFMGLNFNVPGTASYPGSENYSVTFLCDQNYNIRSVLENATLNTFDDATSTGNYNIAQQSSVITLDLLGKGGSQNVVRRYNLIGAYVVSIGDSSYTLGDNGTLQTIPVVLAYQYWRVIKTGISTP